MPTRICINRNVAWKFICVAHLTRCLADRSYTFFLPLFISKHCTSSSTLRPTAALTIVQNLAVALLSTTVSKQFRGTSTRSKDKNANGHGWKIFVRAILLENIAVALGGILIYAVFGRSSGNDSDGNNEVQTSLCESPLSSPYFLYALICAAVDATFSSFLSMIVSKEWVAILFHHSQKKGEGQGLHELPNANARLSQIDLAVATMSPLLISWEIETFGYDKVLMILIGQHLVGAFIIITCVKRAVTLYPPLLFQNPNIDSEKDEDGNDNDKNKKNGKNTRSWSFLQMFTALPIQIRLVSIAYSLLYLTVLSPGAMLNSWMNSLHGSDGGVAMNEKMIAVASSASQFCGAMSTIISPYLVKSTKSLLHASAMAQWTQSGCILLGAYYFYHLNKMNLQHPKESADMVMDEASTSSHLVRFLMALSLSRIGLWTFDLVERQLMQESVSKVHQNLFFNGEKSATQVLSLGMMGLCYVFSDPQSFSFLVGTSVIAVTCSSLCIGLSLILTLG